MRERRPFGLEIWHVAVATILISALAVIVIVAVNTGGESADNQNAGAETLRNEWADADALVPSDDYSGPLRNEWIPFRPREESWSTERVEEHWIDPAPVGRELLDDQVMQRIDGIFEEVP